MVFIEGGNALLGSVNNSSNPPHMETIESFWIKKHPIAKAEMEKLLLDYSVSSDNIGKFVQRLSRIVDCTFDIPTPSQLEYAMRTKDKSTIPSNSIIRQTGDDRMINYSKSSEIVKESKVLVVESISEPVVSLKNGIYAEKFRIVCSDNKLCSIIDKFVRIEEAHHKKKEEEDRQKAEEEARIKAEEEYRIVEKIKIECTETIASIINDMVYVEGGDYCEAKQSEKKSIQSFWIKKTCLSDEQFQALECTPIRENNKLISRLSQIVGCIFELPTTEQIYYANKIKSCIKPYDKDYAFEEPLQDYKPIEWPLWCRAYFRLVCTDSKFDDIKFQLTEKIRKLWLPIVDEFISCSDTFDYEEGVLFMKKKYHIRFLKNPITWRVWNAIMLKDSLDEWGKRDRQAMGEIGSNSKEREVPNPDMKMPNYKLGTFLNKLNEYMEGKVVFEYLRNNKQFEEKLRDAHKIGLGEYLYFKEK